MPTKGIYSSRLQETKASNCFFALKTRSWRWINTSLISPSADHKRQQGNRTTTRGIYYRAARRLCGTQISIPWFSLLASSAQLHAGVTSLRVSDGGFDKVAAISPALRALMLCQSIFTVVSTQLQLQIAPLLSLSGVTDKIPNLYSQFSSLLLQLNSICFYQTEISILLGCLLNLKHFKLRISVC